jgi:NAD(P)-dependent dehydrogenase (short-subunit alcohol dehydrogenase family)
VISFSGRTRIHRRARAAAGLRLDDRVVVVTGASTGLGERFVRVLDAAGAAVVLAARRSQPIDVLAAELLDAFPVRCDVRRSDDRAALVTAAPDRYGRIDVLINNAGIAHSGPAEDEDMAAVEDLINTNTLGLFGLTQLVGRHMLARGRGSIVNIASPSATISLDRYGLAGYAASKGAVVALTRELAAQWAGRGVRVNALSPCFCPSNTSGWLSDPDQVAWISARAPIGRPPAPDELDGPLLFLASDASSYLTGQNLIVDGGARRAAAGGQSMAGGHRWSLS